MLVHHHPLLASMVLWTAFSLFTCGGFTVHRTHQRPSYNRVVCWFKEGEDTAKVVNIDGDEEVGGAIALPTRSESLRQLTFEEDIRHLLDSDRPYYAIKNEHAIVDDVTGESTGFVCTGQLELPFGRESMDTIPFAECLRHAGIAGTITALLRNPKKIRHFYPASQYTADVYQHTGMVRKEIAKISGGDQFLQYVDGSDPIIIARCIDFSKRKAKCEYLIESDSVTCRVVFDFFVIAEPIFQKMYPPTPPVILPELADFNPYRELGSTLSNISKVSAFAGDCLTMEATLPPTKQTDCEGHFVNIPALPHSVMVFHNCDLIGQALSEFTGVDIPFKTQSSGMGFHDHGMRIISWTCSPLTLHFPDTGCLHFQVKVHLINGERGKPSSTYGAQSLVSQVETGKVVYKADGTFMIDPVKFHASEYYL